MKSNRIPRTAKSLQVEFLTDTSGTEKGEIITVYKNDHGWVGQAGDGKHYYFPLTLLRTPEVCRITVLTQ